MVFPDPIGELVVTSKPVLFPNHRWYFMTVSSSTGRFVGYKTATVLSLYHNVTGHDAEYLGESID